MKQHRNKPILTLRTIVFVVFVFVGFGVFFLFRGAPKTVGSEIGGAPPAESKSKANAPRKYSEFPHSKHKQQCDSCHKFPSANWEKVRSADTAFPDITDYPKHESCLSCHRKQFFGSRKPVICSICHTNPGPRNSTRHPFPNPRENYDESPKGKTAVSDFAISFPHETHIGIVAGLRGPDQIERTGKIFVNAGFRRMDQESCKVCHQTYQPQGDSEDEFFTKPPEDLGDRFWLKKGTFKTSPIGHTVCFTCHSADIGILPAQTDCATCHKLKTPQPVPDFDEKIGAEMSITDKITLTQWRGRNSSGTFSHEWMMHADLECATCHNVSAMNTLDAATKKVPVMSCSMCHITATSADGGILNYEVDSRNADQSFACVKCHITYGKLKIPESHLKAIAEQ